MKGNNNEVFELLSSYNAPSAWWQHVPIAHWLINKLQPDCVVELGTHHGVSFFAFCEAASIYARNAHIYAVDTWTGDEQSGRYSNQVFDNVKQHWSKYYKRNSTLIRSTFEEAANHFSMDSVDIIHVDGWHTYDAVCADFQIWKPKLKSGGTVLFHDINVRESDFGVAKFWEELMSCDGVHSIEIRNGHGLGIVTFQTEVPSWHQELLNELNYLTTKGILMENIWELQEKLSQVEQSLNTSVMHGQNLESMLNESNLEQRSLIDRLSSYEASRLVRILKKLGLACKGLNT